MRFSYKYPILFRIFNMSAARIQERSDFLIQFLDLPSKWRLVVNLSGGQQRSVTCSGGAAAKIYVRQELVACCSINGSKMYAKSHIMSDGKSP